ncbi:MAG: tetratricopeptide repeat protein [Verrucomicrobia bacterium]|nr:tetratricopeptide repeat protein [Verrucomicrobiota bacterium]
MLPANRSMRMKKMLLATAVLACLVARADMVQTRTAVYKGQVTHVEGNTVFVKLEQGEFGVPLRDIIRVEVDPPPSYEKGLEALKTGKPQEAIAALKPLVDRMVGLPVPWVIDSLLRLGDAYLELKDTKTAAATFDRLKQLYPNSPQVLAVDVKNAHVLFAQKKYDDVMKVIAAYLEPQLKKDFLPPDQETIVAEALLLRGDCLLVMNKPLEAMDSYFLVVTLYDFDDARAAQARFKGAKVLEQTGNWKRAKEEYEDLLKDAPDSSYAGEAKKRIAEIVKANPQ